jgi:hypothetical protein
MRQLSGNMRGCSGVASGSLARLSSSRGVVDHGVVFFITALLLLILLAAALGLEILRTIVGDLVDVLSGDNGTGGVFGTAHLNVHLVDSFANLALNLDLVFLSAISIGIVLSFISFGLVWREFWRGRVFGIPKKR